MADAGYVAKATRNWKIPQGADTVNAFRYYTTTDGEPDYPDLVTDEWMARAQIRSSAGGDIWVEFLSTSLTGPRISMEDGGYVNVILPSSTTEDPEWNTRLVGFYDVELIRPDGYVIRALRGQVDVTQDYTRV